MTKLEKLIDLVTDYTMQDKQLVSAVFEIVNKKDWTYFCSEMGDYDHPEERKETDEVYKKRNESDY